MSSLSTGASRRVPATLRLSTSRQPDLGRPGARWRQIRNPLLRAAVWAFLAAAQPLETWRRRLRDRDYLQQLPDYLLADMGLDANEVREEARKPFWHA